MSSSEQPEPQESVTSGQSTSQKAKSEADLVIKNPTDGPGTLPFVLSLPVSTTVERLKNELCTKYPGSPSVETQRLIYAGKLLSDSQKLREFLSPHQQNGTPHTIHLVISAPQPPQSFSQASTTQNSSPTVNDNADSSPDAQPPRLPPFAYNGQLFGGQAPRIPLHLQEVEYAEHLQLVESLLAQTLQNAAGTPPDPRLLAQMQQAADMAAAAAAAAAAGSQNVRAQPYATVFTVMADEKRPAIERKHRFSISEYLEPTNTIKGEDSLELTDTGTFMDVRKEMQTDGKKVHILWQFELENRPLMVELWHGGRWNKRKVKINGYKVVSEHEVFGDKGTRHTVEIPSCPGRFLTVYIVKTAPGAVWKSDSDVGFEYKLSIASK